MLGALTFCRTDWPRSGADSLLLGRLFRQRLIILKTFCFRCTRLGIERAEVLRKRPYKLAPCPWKPAWWTSNGMT